MLDDEENQFLEEEFKHWLLESKNSLDPSVSNSDEFVVGNVPSMTLGLTQLAPTAADLSIEQISEVGTDKILARIAMIDYLVFNIDETRAIPGSKARFVIAATRLTQVRYEKAMNTTLYTMVGCSAADGSTLFVLYFLKARRVKSGFCQDF